jgi:hypothetical protein
MFWFFCLGKENPYIYETQEQMGSVPVILLFYAVMFFSLNKDLS